MLRDPNCIFCQPENQYYVIENEHAGLLFDTHPISKGHVLIICKDHYPTFFDVPKNVMDDMYRLILDAKKLVDDKFQPDGYNLDVNIEPAGGQAIMHCHIHLIPRYHHQDPFRNIPTHELLPGDKTDEHLRAAKHLEG